MEHSRHISNTLRKSIFSFSDKTIRFLSCAIAAIGFSLSTAVAATTRPCRNQPRLFRAHGGAGARPCPFLLAQPMRACFIRHNEWLFLHLLSSAHPQHANWQPAPCRATLPRIAYTYFLENTAMTTALVIAEHDNHQLLPATCHAITAAAQCANEVHVLVAGHNAAVVAQATAQLAGVDKVLHADAPMLANPLAENLATQVLAVAASYSHIVFAATANGKNTAPRVAAKLDVAQVSDVTRIISPNTFERPIYAGNAFATVQSSDAIQVLTMRTTSFDAAVTTDNTAVIENVATVSDRGMSTFVNREEAKSDRPDLTTARVIVTGGRGLDSAEAFNVLLTPLADKLGAAIGASRAAVDAGYAPNALQVGQTGKIVAPDLYIACGISGAIQHLAGMKDSKVIVAINKDPDAPIASLADYFLEADVATALPELTQAL